MEPAPGSLPLGPTTIAPWRSPAILVPEDVLPQLCRERGIVTHSPPSPRLFWSWAPHSVLLSLLPHSASLLNTLCAQALGKPLGWCLELFLSFCHPRELVTRATGEHCLPLGQARAPLQGRGQGPSNLCDSGSFRPQFNPSFDWLVRWSHPSLSCHLSIPCANLAELYRGPSAIPELRPRLFPLA